MAYSAFSVTATLLQSDVFPTYPAFSATTQPTSTAVGTIIQRRAALVCGYVDALGLDASAIDSTGEPLSFYFLQRLVLVGSAIDVAAAFTGKSRGDGLVGTWRQEWNDGIKRLADVRQAKVALVDAFSTSRPGYIRTHIQHGSQTPSGSSDVLIDNPEFTADMDL